MALGALTLSTTQGVQGRPFGAVINGLTTGKVEVLGDGSPGFSTVNGRVNNNSLPYPISTVVLREYEPGVGQGYRDSRIDIAAATREQLAATALASVGPGRVLRGFRVAGERLLDGTISYSVRVEDDLGATVSASVGTPPLPLPSFTTNPSISPTSGAAGATFTANDGVIANGIFASRQWLLSGTASGTGTTVVPVTPGSLVLEVTATRADGSGSVVQASAAVTVSAAAPTLNALTLDSSSATQNSPVTINILGATAGSTIAANQLPAGLTLNSAARTITGTPTAAATTAIVLTETLTGASNSPRTSNVSISVAAATVADYVVTTQAQWDALPFASLAGKTVEVQPLAGGASYVSGVNGTAARFRRIDLAGCVVRGPSAAAMPKFSDIFYLRGTRGLTLRWLDVGRGLPGSKIVLYSEAANPCGNVVIDGCVCIGVEGDPNGDYSVKDSYPNTGDAIIMTRGGATAYFSAPITIKNCDVRWCAGGINLIADQILTVSGNHVSHFYDDGIGIAVGQGANVSVTDNLVHDCVGVSTDAPRTGQVTGPHCDAIRGLGGVVSGVVQAVKDSLWQLHRNVIYAGTSRGRRDMQCVLLSDMKSGATDSGYFYTVTAIGNVIYSENSISLAIENAKDCFVSNNTVVSTRQNTIPTITTRIGTGSSDATSSGTHTVRRHITDSLLVAGSPTITDSLVLGKNGATTSYETVFDNPAVLTARGTLLSGLNRKTGGPADIAGAYDIGAIGSGAVVFANANPGSDGSNLVPVA